MEDPRQEETQLCYEFGPFRADTVKCVLTRDGDAIPVSLKVFELLLALLEHRGQVLEKEYLLHHVWPDTVVEENNLARAISALRKALGEQPNEHRYILTIPGRGYRFVATVRVVGAQEGATTELSRLSDQGRGPAMAASGSGQVNPRVLAGLRNSVILRKGRALTIGAVVIVGAASAAVFFFARPHVPTDQPVPQRNLWQLTFGPGLQGEPSWSPDGRMIAYSSDRNGNFDIWVQPAGEGSPIAVTTSPAHDWQPDWAPEGNLLAFRSEREGGGLYVVPVLGGAERRVSSFGYRPRWSPDGSLILFTSNLRTVSETPKSYLVGLDGELPREVLSDFLSNFGPARVSWHPDGRRLSIWGNHRELGWSFWTVPLGGDPPVRSEITTRVAEQLRDGQIYFTDFQWSHRGDSLYFEGTCRGVKNLWKVDVDPETLSWLRGPERLTTGAAVETDIALSKDGRRLAFSARNERARLWSLPFDSVTGHLKGAGEAITPAGVDALYPELSPDGQKLVYLVQKAERRELREKSLIDGRETLLRPVDEFYRVSPHWSRDGSTMTYFRAAPARPGRRAEGAIFLLSTGGHPEQNDEQVLTMSGRTPWDFSPDGKWVLAGSPPDQWSICLYPIAAAPHAETQMRVLASDPEQNFYQARFSPDGRWISFCAAPVHNAGTCTIYVVPSNGGERRQITEGTYFDDKPRWSSDGRTLYFVSNRTGFLNVWGVRFDSATGERAGEAFRVTAFQSPSLMVAPDVRFMEMALAAHRLVLPVNEVSGDIWILDNLGANGGH